MRLKEMTRGFTLIEVVLSVILLGIVSAAVASLLRHYRIFHQRQIAAVNMNNTLRTGLNILRSELLGLNAADRVAGDLLVIAADSLVYRAHRSLLFLCKPPDTLTNEITVFHGDSLRFPRLGLSLNPTEDSLLIYAEHDVSTRSDDGWVRAGVLATRRGAACPGGQASVTVTVAGASLRGVRVGAPTRGTQIWKLKSYADSRGEWWLGAQQVTANGTAGAVQPVVGPLSGRSGIAFEYLDSTANVTADPRLVQRVSITVTSRSDRQVMTVSGRRFATAHLRTDVMLRNNPWY